MEALINWYKMNWPWWKLRREDGATEGLLQATDIHREDTLDSGGVFSFPGISRDQKRWNQAQHLKGKKAALLWSLWHELSRSGTYPTASSDRVSSVLFIMSWFCESGRLASCFLPVCLHFGYAQPSCTDADVSLFGGPHPTPQGSHEQRSRNHQYIRRFGSGEGTAQL